jgi:predicted metal-dependent HD superfamily phosphohydrolase
MDVQRSWAALAAALGAPAAWATATAADLEARYREPHRAYHTLEHVQQVLDTVDELIAAGEPVADPLAVRLAAWFHDAVYEPLGGGNERASADLAIRALRAGGVDPVRRAAAAALVLDTADHVPRSADARVLVDADLAILAAPPEAYERYTLAVRREYAALPEDRWLAGRSAVLSRLDARRPLYATATMRERAEARAHRNLAAERHRLLGGAPDVPA